ncbi:MAG: hypothetical protein KZQ95_15905 [Candidatus Thiodiazotropha sp. (ex Epidulcina cf. delphinae)]|nr:hypothetical protein [Candidatus Thiodiazotropha sp. (ex Epidulcina cf. delphinae)]
MKNANKHADKKVLESNVSARIKEIAVQHGFRLPQSQEEVALFEETYAHLIQKANLNPPPLKEMLALANKLNRLDQSIVKHQATTPIDHRYAMAARNGQEITSEIEARMEEALRKVKLEKKNNE